MRSGALIEQAATRRIRTQRRPHRASHRIGKALDARSRLRAAPIAVARMAQGEAQLEAIEELVDRAELLASAAFSEQDAPPLERLTASWKTTLDEHRALIRAFVEGLAHAERSPEVRDQTRDHYRRISATSRGRTRPRSARTQLLKGLERPWLPAALQRRSPKRAAEQLQVGNGSPPEGTLVAVG